MAKRVISTTFWMDDKVVESFTPEDKLFFLYLMTNPHTTQLGIYHINKKVMAFEIGYSIEAVGSLLERFENKYDIIKYSQSTSEVAIKNFLKHSIIRGGNPIFEQLLREIDAVKDKSLLRYIYENLEKEEKLNSTVEEILPFIDINANANANANAVTDAVTEPVTESVTYDVTETRPKRQVFTPPSLDDVKTYCEERGNNIDAEAFIAFYDSKGWMVGSNKMKNWKSAVITWEKRNDNTRRTQPTQEQKTRIREDKDYEDW